MTRPPRWWEVGERSVEDEAKRFAEAGFDVELDKGAFSGSGTVIFHVDLRYREEHCPATVVYPPTYGAGAHPEVYAPGMPIVSEHKRVGDGLLCLDHRVFGEAAPMTGAEAVERAERLWRLAMEDPDELAAQSVSLPTVRAELFRYDPGSAVFALEPDTSGAGEGWLSLRVEQEEPFRASMVTLGRDLRVPDDSALQVGRAPEVFGGDLTVMGFWRRVSSPPILLDAAGIRAWAEAEHPDLVQHAKRWAGIWQGIEGRPGPALVAFVYEDEGPRVGETYEAWLVLIVNPDGSVGLPHPFPLTCDGQFTRQPQLRPLAKKRIGVVGAGALGSQIALLLGRAGAGGFFVCDHDLVTPGIVIRHAADVTASGAEKAADLRLRLAGVNPFVNVVDVPLGYGSAVGPGPDPRGFAQQLEDEIGDELAKSHLIVDASADDPTGYRLAELAAANKTPLLSVAVSAGGWGARILLQRPGRSGCLECLGRHRDGPVAETPSIPEWPADPDAEETFERGCAQATFTAPGFELAAAAAAAARCGVQLLLHGEGYPPADFDLVTLRFRDATTAQPTAEYTALPQHPACTSCRV